MGLLQNGTATAICKKRIGDKENRLPKEVFFLWEPIFVRYLGKRLFRGGPYLMFSQKRIKMVATWARVAVPAGFRALLPMPLTRLAPTAQDRASWA